MNDDKENKIEDNKEIEVVIGDTSDLKFSEVEEFVEALKPKLQKKSNIIIPGKDKKEKTEKDSKKKD